MTVAQYIDGSSPLARKALKQLRATIRKAATGITERISYRIPVFELDGQYLPYIAGFENHVSVYPVTAGMVARYGKAMARFRHGKGTLRFSLTEPLPLDLVSKLAKLRVRERRVSRQTRKAHSKRGVRRARQ